MSRYSADSSLGLYTQEVGRFGQRSFYPGASSVTNYTAAAQPLPIRASSSLNFRNAIPYVSKKDGILEYVWEQGTRKYQLTHDHYNKPRKIWESVAEEFFSMS
ncbi:hypothetical protein DFH09DRAFT_1313861 [Mycena vulgaris]|nr:hypothetical protein DFH09DRAFT_1313861 [Mycena vulgaris]